MPQRIAVKSLVYVAGSVIVPFVVQTALLFVRDQIEFGGLAPAAVIKFGSLFLIAISTSIGFVILAHWKPASRGGIALIYAPVMFALLVYYSLIVGDSP
jgi:hypothetical protein